jgi:hypothetical protein
MRVSRTHAAILDPNLQRGIGKQLRTMYDEMMDQVPGCHLDLLQRFEQDEAPGCSGATKASVPHK